MNTLKIKWFLFWLTGLFLFCGADAQGKLTGYWPLNETAGVTATNLAIGGTTGILTNDPTWFDDTTRGRILSSDGIDDHVIAGVVTADIISRPFYMGGDRFNERWSVYLDDVAIWTEALPTNAIAGLANGTCTPLTAPIYPCGPFDLTDAVGGGDGRLPAYGGNGDLAATASGYTTFPNNLFVDGTLQADITLKTMRISSRLMKFLQAATLAL